MKKLSFLTGLLLLLVTGCNKDEATTSLVVRLTDSPGDYESVFIDIESVQVHVNEGDQEDGWITLNSNAGIYDLLSLTDGVETVIATDEFPTGHVSQLRLVLGSENSVVVDGITYSLTVPSGSESGLKLQIHADLVEGIAYSVLLDFDAAKSVHKTGSDKYILKPVIKTITEAIDGAVTGTVIPADLNVAVFALSGSDTVGTSYAVQGNTDFFLGGLGDDDYTISFDPGELSGYNGHIIDNVSVSVGSVTDIGEIELTQ